jgi:hypothetical protein
LPFTNTGWPYLQNKKLDLSIYTVRVGTHLQKIIIFGGRDYTFRADCNLDFENTGALGSIFDTAVAHKSEDLIGSLRKRGFVQKIFCNLTSCKILKELSFIMGNQQNFRLLENTQ